MSRPTEGMKPTSWAKHLKKDGKRKASKASRRFAKLTLKNA